MASNKYLIAPFNSGLVKDQKAWMIPEEAFPLLQNMYVWRGRLRKRCGTSLLYTTGVAPANPQIASRLRIKVGTTNGAGNLGGVVPGVIRAVGQMFSAGDQLFTVNDIGNPITMLNSTGLGMGTYDTTTGAYVFTGIVINTDVYFYPATPVMGFATFETATQINYGTYLAFDTQFAYQYDTAVGWKRLAGGADTWTGSDSDFYSITSFNGSTLGVALLFVVNNTVADGIRYFNEFTGVWAQLANSYGSDPNEDILTARLIIQFKNRLILLNTWENPGAVNPTNYPNRARYCQIGDPTQVDAWYEPPYAYGKGGFIDAPTQQKIISAQIFKDRLIVYFERSTWELVYTGNQVLPFVWQNINIELGSESSFSLVTFDKGIVGVGQTGVHVCNGTGVERIDDKIPDDIYTIQNINAGIDRVYGIRDYVTEMVYWAVPDINGGWGPQIVYPNQILVYNYKNNSWAYWTDTVTAFGYIQLPVLAQFSTSETLLTVAGNQEGYTFYIDQNNPTNAGVTQITDITILLGGQIQITAINHNLQGGEYIYIQYVTGTLNIPLLNGKIYEVTYDDANNFIITDNNVLAGVYHGAGTYALVSQIDVQTKQFNFFVGDGNNIGLSKLDMLVSRTTSSEFTVNIYPSSSTIDTQSLTMTTAPYNVAYYPLEANQDLLWHTVYPSSTGSFVQLEFTWTDAEMTNPAISLQDVQIHAIMIHVDKTASRLQ